MSAKTIAPVNDVFAQVPEFLAAFNNILEKGFFESVQFHVGSPMSEGALHLVSILCSGCVPSDKKYEAKGCGLVIDPNTVVATCRKLVAENQVKNVTTNVETNDWSLYDEKDGKVIGSRGQRTKLSLHITFTV